MVTDETDDLVSVGMAEMFTVGIAEIVGVGIWQECDPLGGLHLGGIQLELEAGGQGGGGGGVEWRRSGGGGVEE